MKKWRGSHYQGRCFVGRSLQDRWHSSSLRLPNYFTCVIDFSLLFLLALLGIIILVFDIVDLVVFVDVAGSQFCPGGRQEAWRASPRTFQPSTRNAAYLPTEYASRSSASTTLISNPPFSLSPSSQPPTCRSAPQYTPSSPSCPPCKSMTPPRSADASSPAARSAMPRAQLARHQKSHYRRPRLLKTRRTQNAKLMDCRPSVAYQRRPNCLSRNRNRDRL
jgi:hypothetical protein